jgi:hypothetical protein
MPAFAPPADDERALLGFLAHQQNAFRAVAHGLTDDQARLRPTASALSIGGLIKHVTGVQRSWTERIAAAPNPPPPDPRPLAQQAAEFQDGFVLRSDETLAEVMAEFAAQNTETLRHARNASLDAAVPVPRDTPWFPADVDAWSVRWVLLHLIGELARHAGHADIIRESVDGATMAELVAALDFPG